MITSRAWAGKRYAVLGLARSGMATVRALLASGAEVVAWDEREEARSELRSSRAKSRHLDAAGPSTSLGTNGLLEFADPLTLDLTGFAGVVVSPGVPLNRHPIAQHSANYGVPIIGDIELFAQARGDLPAHKVVGITGTNGKSTTTALVHHILKLAGVPTTMGGNIGLPILGQEPLPEGGVYVLELSSFQIDLTFTLDCDVAVLLNVTPDHLDRYDGFEAYGASKARLFEMQSPAHYAIRPDTRLSPDDPFDIWGPWAGDGRPHRDASSLGTQADWPTLQGPHNAENALVATSVARIFAVPEETVSVALRTYPGLPHRMERIREKDGVLYVNDSKATNPTSTAPALAAYPVIHWILGGQAKTDELDACLPYLGHVKTAFTIGRDGAMLAALLRPHVPVAQSDVLSQAVRRASLAAKPGETVLLSPACASFDQFRDFEDRGDQFRQLVEAL